MATSLPAAMSIEPVPVRIIVGTRSILPLGSAAAKLPSSVTLPCWVPLNMAAACTASGLALLTVAPATSRKVELLPPMSDADGNGNGLLAVGIGEGELSATAGGDTVVLVITGSGCSTGGCNATMVGMLTPVRRAVWLK